MNCVSMSLWGQLSILSLPLEFDTALMGMVPAVSKLGPEFFSLFLLNQQLFVLSVRELQSLLWLVPEPSQVLAQKHLKKQKNKEVGLSDLSLHALSIAISSALTPYL